MLDISISQQGSSEWKSSSWIPVADDGCGNAWVLDGADPSDDAVYFVDVSEPGRLDHVAASTLERFLFTLLTNELSRSGWPFNREELSRIDPLVLQCQLAPMPWA